MSLDIKWKMKLYLFIYLIRFDVIDDNKERIAEDIKFADKLLRQKVITFYI